MYSHSATGALVCTHFSPRGSGYTELWLDVELLELVYWAVGMYWLPVLGDFTTLRLVGTLSVCTNPWLVP